MKRKHTQTNTGGEYVLFCCHPNAGPVRRHGKEDVKLLMIFLNCCKSKEAYTTPLNFSPCKTYSKKPSGQNKPLMSIDTQLQLPAFPKRGQSESRSNLTNKQTKRGKPFGSPDRQSRGGPPVTKKIASPKKPQSTNTAKPVKKQKNGGKKTTPTRQITTPNPSRVVIVISSSSSSEEEIITPVFNTPRLKKKSTRRQLNQEELKITKAVLAVCNFKQNAHLF